MSGRQKHCGRIVSCGIKRWILTAVKVELGNGSGILAFRKRSYKKENGGIIFKLSIKVHCLQKLLLGASDAHARVNCTTITQCQKNLFLFHLCHIRLTVVVSSPIPTLLANFLWFFSCLSFF